MMKQEIIQIISRHAVSEGMTETPFEGLSLYRSSLPMERVQTVYQPCVCGVVQGRKRVFLNGTSHAYDSRQYLTATMPIPVEAEVQEVSEEKPLLGFLLHFDSRVFRETLVATEVKDGFPDSQVEGTPSLCVTGWDEAVRGALLRVLQLLEDPGAQRVLADARMMELSFAILRGGAGPAIRRALGGAHDMTRAVNHLKENLHQPITIDELAGKAGMSRAVFHRKFKEVTSYSPIQFIKALRLNQAAMLIAGGATAGEAAYQVGYTSQSQFSREYRRHFGHTPRQRGGSSGLSSEVLATVVNT